ncbi:hypothetical protein [Corynebacterium sphenisci]|uniref:hypothetical protein n=1 Tax=Corynebacterium sphenisci TaxID=191493 RepID=UPI0026E06818|nr:hypothetical protein [Corynebacterium sphenisci]MDO5730634.1 hypothetical protein [Corynebacterium sphenisci]
MRNRLTGALAAGLIASAALVACSPPNEQDSDVQVTDQENTVRTYESDAGATTAGTEAETDSAGYGAAQQ